MSSLQPVLAPPKTKDHVSVARVLDHWYVAARSRALKKKPLKRTILGVPLVLFRDASGEAGTLLDRCPHRNIPLSMGKVQSGLLECGYHGWRFDKTGTCRLVPGLCGPSEGKARNAPFFPTVEQDGYVWVYLRANASPDTRPYTFPHLGEKGYTSVRRELVFEGSLHGTIENALDVPHTAFLHTGLFRGTGKKNKIEAVVRRETDRVEAEFLGEPSPRGLIGRLLAPGGGTLIHFDRFILPSIAQVEYRLGDRSHMLVTSVCTPISDFRTQLNAVVSFKLPVPGWLVKLFIQPVALKILKQDAKVLQAQTRTIARFGGEQFVSTDIDLLGGPIWRMLKEAESGRGKKYASPEEIKRITFES